MTIVELEGGTKATWVEGGEIEGTPNLGTLVEGEAPLPDPTSALHLPPLLVFLISLILAL